MEESELVLKYLLEKEKRDEETKAMCRWEDVADIIARGSKLVSPEHFEQIAYWAASPSNTRHARYDLEYAFDLLEAKKNQQLSEEAIESLFEETLKKIAQFDFIWNQFEPAELLVVTESYLYALGEAELSMKVHGLIESGKAKEITRKVAVELGKEPSTFWYRANL
jgi:hypothetical protein